MAGPDPTESRPPNNVHARPSPLEERPSQRIRREDESQITRLSLYGHTHFVSHPPFTPHNSPRSVPYDMLVQEAKEVDLEGNNVGQAAGSGTMPIESIHNTRQRNPGISEDKLMDQQLDQLIASCGPAGENVFDNLGAILASYQPDSSGGTGLDANGSGNPTHQFQGATGFTPQMATQQAADRSCSDQVSASSSCSLTCSQRYSNIQADPYHVDQSLRPESGSFTQHGFASIPPPIAGPSTANTSTSSYPQSHSINYRPNLGPGTYLDPPHASSMARSLSTSDVPSMAAVPGDFSGLSASSSTSGNLAYAQAQYASTAGQIPSVNARRDDPRTASAIKTSNARTFHETPPSQRFTPSLSQPSMTSPVPRPSLFTTTPVQPVSNPIDPDLQTVNATESSARVSAGGPSGGPMAEGSADQGRTTLKEDTQWIDRSAVLTALLEEMRSRCKVPEGIERVRAFRGLRYLFKEMFELCYNDDPGPHVDRRAVSHLSTFRRPSWLT